jgi:hypothetical protein
MHNRGLAVDFANSQGQMLRDPNSPEARWIAANAERFGLAVPMSWEPWQVELANARGTAPNAIATQYGRAEPTNALAQGQQQPAQEPPNALAFQWKDMTMDPRDFMTSQPMPNALRFV